MKIAFMGSDAIALPMLKHLREEQAAAVEIDCVFTQPDRRSGRGMKLRMNAIKEWAIEEGIDVFQPKKCGADEATLLSDRGIELVLVMAYGQILPKVMLAAPPKGTLNMHASVLPRLRGASPIHTAVAIGLEETGVSLMQIVPKMDAGPVADVQKVSIDPDDKTSQVWDKLAAACIPLIDRNLSRIVSGELEFIEQDDGQVTYCRIIDKSDNHLDFNQPASELYNRIRAFQPWPGTTFLHRDIELKILEAEVDQLPKHGQPNGSVGLDADGKLSIYCGEDRLRLLKLQRPGGKPLETEVFLRGYPISDGELLQSREMRPLEGPVPFPYKRK
ncbi:MAG: methionyl-tRNA formyltransferase [Puniceicoccaceae bacterium]